MISKTGKHAILALITLAELEPGQSAGASQIASKIDAPGNYLGKLLKQLASEGLLESRKGFGGGFRLALPANKITLFDVINPFDKISRWNGCFLSGKRCSDKTPCAVHKRWGKVRQQYLDFLKGTTIAEVAQNQVKLSK